MQNQILETEYILPLTYLYNGGVDQTEGQWTNPQYLLLQDTLTAESSPSQGAVCSVMVGNFNFNIPSTAVITGIQFKVRGNVGAITAPPATLTFNAYNNLPPTPEFYPYTAPFSDFTQDLADYIFGSPTYLFNRAWTVDEINNFKLQLLGAGDLFIDDVQAQVFYYIPSTILPPTPDNNMCATCESPIQGVEYFLAVEMTATDTKAYVYDFNLADGTPIQISDLGDCGGVLEIVIDEGKSAINGNNFMENCAITNITVLPSGLVELDFGSLDNRGLGFVEPWTHIDALIGPHSVNAKLIISNSGPYEGKKIRTCQIGTVVSAPIDVKLNGADIVNPAVKFNFSGAVQVTQDGTDLTQANIFIPGIGTTPAVVVSTSTATSGGVQVGALGTGDTWMHTTSGVDRALSVSISMEGGKTITGATYNGIALSHDVDATLNAVRSEKWTLLAPPVGTFPIIVIFSAPSYASGEAASLVGVDQTTPVGSTQSSTGTSMAPSLILTTTYDNSVIIDSLSTAQQPILYIAGAGQTLIGLNIANADVRQGGASYTGSGTAPDAVTMQYAITQNTDWAYTAVEYKGITTTPPPVSGVTVQDTTGVVSVANLTKMVFPNGSLTNPNTGEGDIDLSATRRVVTQTAHGFAEGDVVRSSGTANQYTLSQADTAAHAEVDGWVDIVIDVDTFVLVSDGFITGGIPAQTAGTIMFLDNVTAGGVTVTEPTTAGTVSKPLVQIIQSATIAKFTNYRGKIQDGTTSATTHSAFPVPSSSGGGSIPTVNFYLPFSLLTSGGSVEQSRMGCDLSQIAPTYYWVANYISSDNKISIYRLEKQTNGNYIYKGINTNVSLGGTTFNGILGICETGSKVYMWYRNNGTVDLVQLDTGLSTQTAITGFSSTFTAEQNDMVSDPVTSGTVWALESATVLKQYSISGTAATLVSTVTLGSSVGVSPVLYLDSSYNVSTLSSRVSPNMTQSIKKYNSSGTLLSTTVVSVFNGISAPGGPNLGGSCYGLSFVNLAGSPAFASVENLTDASTHFSSRVTVNALDL